MKNTVITVLVLTTMVFGYIAATKSWRLKLEGLEGKTETITRGDLTLPINATGQIRPYHRVEIKSEASGEVIEIGPQPGEYVNADEILIRLDPEEEQRNVNRARLDLEMALAQLEESKLDWKRARTADLQSTRATVEQMAANVEFARFRAERADAEPELFHEEERLQRRTSYQSQNAQLDNARAAHEKAKILVPRAEQTVRRARAAYQSRQQTLADAERRLSKTDITSPIAGVLADIRTHIGEVIQGGKTTITGGTVLAIVLDLERILVRAEVDEADIGRVLDIAPRWAKPGRESEITMPGDIDRAAQNMQHLPIITVESFRDEEFTGIIEKIYPEPTSLQGVVTYMVDVVIVGANRDKLLSGMRADVRFTSEHVENAVLCPNEAIREGAGGKLGVYIPKPGGMPDQHETEFLACRFGLDNGNYSQVIEGLTEGMTVYIKLPAKTGRD